MLGEILERLTGNYRGDRPTLEQLTNGTAYQKPKPQPQAPMLSLESLAQGTKNVATGIGDFLTGDDKRRDSERLAYEIGGLQRKQQDREFGNKLFMQQQRQLGQGTQAANQAGTAMNDDPSRGPIGPWRVRRDPYSDQIIAWETPITQRQEAHREFSRFDPATKEKFKVDASGKEIPGSREPAVSDFQSDKEAFNRALDLGTKWYSESKNYFGAKEAYNNLLAAAEDPSPAGDIALIFAFMKTLDPNSTVREGEFATAENAGSVGETIRNKYNRVLAGERLGATRQDFVNQGTKAFERKRKQQDIVNKRWERKAKAFRVDPNLVIDLEEMKMPESQRQQGEIVPADKVKVVTP
jgi:hypothetical protein